jgi:hypothetical protein
MIFFLSFSVLAQEKLVLENICNGTGGPKNMIVSDKGFCAEFRKAEVDDIVKNLDQGIEPVVKQDCLPQAEGDKLKIRIYMSHSFTDYFKSNVSFRSTQYNVDIKDYVWAERGSRNFFTLEEWKKPGSNPAQMIDEPSNTFVISIEKNRHEFFLSAFHPKFLQAVDQLGAIVVPVGLGKEYFDLFGKSIDYNGNTHRQMTFEIGYGYRFTLLEGKLGSINYIPSIGVGVMVGNNLSIIGEERYNDAYGIQGLGGSITNRLEINSRKERVGFFYENKLAAYQMDHGFMDGTQKYYLGFTGNSFGLKFMIYNPKNKKKKMRPF